jgi:hypothetical protein
MVIVGPGWVTVRLCVSVAWIVCVCVSSGSGELEVFSVGWVEVACVGFVSTTGSEEAVGAMVDVEKAAVAPSET